MWQNIQPANRKVKNGCPDCFESAINQLSTLKNLQNDPNIMKIGQ